MILKQLFLYYFNFNYLSLLNVAWTFSPWDASGKDVEMYPPPPNLGDY